LVFIFLWPSHVPETSHVLYPAVYTELSIFFCWPSVPFRVYVRFCFYYVLFFLLCMVGLLVSWTIEP